MPSPGCPPTGVRAVLINSGNANALTGAQGLEDVVHVRRGARCRPRRRRPTSVLTASTGVIGVRLPAQKIAPRSPGWSRRSAPSAEPAAEAILTTDTRTKMASPVARRSAAAR